MRSSTVAARTLALGPTKASMLAATAPASMGAPGDVNYGAGLSPSGLLGPLANNGGPSEMMLPLAGDPAVGVVPNSTSAALDRNAVSLCSTTDQRGVPSTPWLACNAGSVQYVGTVTVTAPAATEAGQVGP